MNDFAYRIDLGSVTIVGCFAFTNRYYNALHSGGPVSQMKILKMLQNLNDPVAMEKATSEVIIENNLG